MINRLKKEAGYSLVEVMVAIMLLSIAIIPMVGMFDAGLRAAVLGSNYDKARALAHEKLEEVRALPFRRDPNPPVDSLVEIYPPGTRPCTGATPPPFDCQARTTYARLDDDTGAVVPDSSARTMMQVTVTVTWNGHSYSTTGLVSKEMT